MAKRILSADSALMPGAQAALSTSVRTEHRGELMKVLEERWKHNLSGQAGSPLFDWEDQREMREEIEFVNRAQTTLDEAAVKLAPSLLRIVLTVKAHLPTPREQRAFLGEHLRLDFRRVSELCIVADSFGLLDAEYRKKGEREIEKYGWSNALKLAPVRDPYERRDIWERACNGKANASYREVLEEIRRFRERKLIAPLIGREDLEARLGAARRLFSQFNGAAAELSSRDGLRSALEGLEELQKELAQLKRAMKERYETVEIEELAASA